MDREKLNEEELTLLNSKVGLEAMFRGKRFNVEKVLTETRYEQDLKDLQVELIKLQTWVITNKKKIVILFEGHDAAGKGGAIRRITEYINPRHFKIVALDKPSSDERAQWFFQRYISHLPKPGEIVFFDRSWYNRAVVEPVNGFCTREEYQIFMEQVNEFERMIMQADTYLIKFYFSITKEEQARRFEDIQKNPLKRWKMTPLDLKAQELWDEYTTYKLAMLEKTNTKAAPWKLIEADKKSKARMEAIRFILDTIPYGESQKEQLL